ncbi:MAG: tRNA 4-thiouridine(8) synthase ThiI [Kiritimatiellae bacterium]|nr:tRNA 4-thiouridine(8) synthase ThiI [Kiritimatiellia bacterium]
MHFLNPDNIARLGNSLFWSHIVVHFDEIALKGGNRQPFTYRLWKNITLALTPFAPKFDKFHDRLVIVPASPDHISPILTATAQLFGVAYTIPIKRLELSIEAMSQAGVKLYKTLAKPNDSFRVTVKRVHKKFPMTSTEIQQQIGHDLQQATHAPVDLHQPDITLFFRMYKDYVYLEGPRCLGPGGLPVGTAGSVLTLFSGGIDSPAAAWLIMRRGCITHFVHFHVFSNAESVRETKIPALIRKVLNPHRLTAKLFLVPYHPFSFECLKTHIPERLELAFFRRFMMRTADALAEREKLSALITGDNLSQVASQTIENLTALEGTFTRPVFRPLLTYNKPEIIQLTKRIDTYEQSTTPYKDCCSLVTKHPHTKPKQEKVLEAESSLDTKKMTEQALDETVIWTIE